MPRAKQGKRALSVNQVFAYRLRDARKTKGWTQGDLADAMARIGHRVSVPTIAKIEAGRYGVGGDHGKEGSPTTFGRESRDVTLERAIAFAAALDVPPPSLFFPIGREDDVKLAPAVQVDVETAHAWARGERPLHLEPKAGRTVKMTRDHPATYVEGTADDDQFYRFQTFLPRSRPGGLADLDALRDGGWEITLRKKED